MTQPLTLQTKGESRVCGLATGRSQPPENMRSPRSWRSTKLVRERVNDRRDRLGFQTGPFSLG